MSDLVERVAPLVSRASRAGIFLDFDGTLSPVVEQPDQARPLPGVTDALVALATAYETVAVVSGRPVAFLQRLLPSQLVMAGLYGLEVVRDGHRHDHPQAAAWRAVVDEVVQTSTADGPAGMGVESKGVSLTLHYRTRPELEDDVKRWAASQADRSGLLARPARMSVELHPPIDADKGTALDALAEGLEAACYVGDDAGDLPAFDALDRLAQRDVVTLRVAVGSDESPRDVIDRADLVVNGPTEVLDLLHALMPAGGT